MKSPKLLFFDIESSYNSVLSFGIYEQDIPYDNIVIERHLFCVSYKWFGEKEIHTISILDNKKRFRSNIHDDYYVLSEFRKVVEEADAIIGHYSNGFDIPMINARLAFNNLPPLPKVISIDTKAIASQNFRFNCNKLDYLGKFLGYGGKLDNPKNLWIECFNGDVKALEHMAKYNRKDVELLEFVFKKLMPFAKVNKLNAALFNEEVCCVNPACGSFDIQWRGWNYTLTNKYRRFVCKRCGKWGSHRNAVVQLSPLVK